MTLKEHDFGLVTTRGIVRGGQLIEVKQEHLKAPPKMPQCPFRRGAFGSKCQTNCTMYQKGACALAIEGAGETLGKNCPFVNGPCSEDCALYSGGCGLITIAQLGRKE